MICDVIYSLLVLIEKLAFFYKQLYRFIISLKELNVFSKYVKFLINYRIIEYRSKIIELLPQYGRKNLATAIFLEQIIKGKLNTRFI